MGENEKRRKRRETVRRGIHRPVIVTKMNECGESTSRGMCEKRLRLQIRSIISVNSSKINEKGHMRWKYLVISFNFRSRHVVWNQLTSYDEYDLSGIYILQYIYYTCKVCTVRNRFQLKNRFCEILLGFCVNGCEYPLKLFTDSCQLYENE